MKQLRQGQEDYNRIVELYNSGYRIVPIAKLMNKDRKTIRRVLEHANVEMRQIRRGEDLTGQILGKIKVISKVENTENGKGYRWNCECDCGCKFEIGAGYLLYYKRRECPKCSRRNAALNRPKKIYTKISLRYIDSIIRGAKIRNLEYSVTNDYLWNIYEKQNRLCAISKLPIIFAKSCTEQKERKATASLDRIDSSKGYVEGNVQWVHKHINEMKKRYTDEYYTFMCQQVAKNTTPITKNIEDIIPYIKVVK